MGRLGSQEYCSPFILLSNIRRAPGPNGFLVSEGLRLRKLSVSSRKR